MLAELLTDALVGTSPDLGVGAGIDRHPHRSPAKLGRILPGLPTLHQTRHDSATLFHLDWFAVVADVVTWAGLGIVWRDRWLHDFPDTVERGKLMIVNIVNL